MYIIKNIVEDKIIGEFKSDTDFIRFMRKIAIESVSISILTEFMNYFLFENFNLYRMLISFSLIYVIKIFINK